MKTIYTGGFVPNLAIEDDPENPFFGWLLAQHPDGQMVSLAKIDGVNEKPVSSLPDGYVMVPVELVAFLKGVGTLEGMSFGEYPAPSEGDFTRKFWWRKHLPEIPLENDGPSGSSCDIEREQFTAAQQEGDDS